MTRRADLAAAIRPFASEGRIPQNAVAALDALADALGIPRDGGTSARLGSLSERYESGGRGPGTVSSGAGDPGGVSYGLYQLSSKAGTARAFVANEGRHWAALLPGAPGSAQFSAGWKDVAGRDPEAFAEAQHAFIKRTHYQPAVEAVKMRAGVDLDARGVAVRNAVWSVAVQHSKAAEVLLDGLARAGTGAGDADLIRAIYAARAAYVTGVAQRQSGASRKTLLSIVQNRYPDELRRALAMVGAE